MDAGSLLNSVSDSFHDLQRGLHYVFPKALKFLGELKKMKSCVMENIIII